jgi:transcriptional regulator GlxA family with amidase domain
MTTPARTRTLALLMFPEVEVLDFAGPFEVFSVAGEVAGAPLFDVRLVAPAPGIVRATGGLPVQVTHSLADVASADVLLVPGGAGARRLPAHPVTTEWIRHVSAGAELVLSVCTGAFALAAAGVLDGVPCTTHWEFVARLRAARPGLEVRERVRFVDTGRIVTSAGISAGIDMSLHVVGRLHGLELARATAQAMEYDWEPTSAA